MTSFIALLKESLKMLVIVTFMTASGFAICAVRGIPTERIASTVAVPIVAIILVFKMITALPIVSESEEREFLRTFSNAPKWTRRATELAGADLVFIIVTALCSLAYLVLNMQSEADAAWNFTVNGTALFFLLMLAPPLVHSIRGSTALRELKVDVVLALALQKFR